MKRFGSSLFALALGVAAAFVLGEVVLRVSGVWIGRHSDTMFSVIEHDEQLGWKMPPGIFRRVDFVDVEGIAVRSNSDGFWDDEFVVEPPAGTCRIAFLGDSFTWGMGVEEEDRFSNLIERQTAGVEALNFGMPGFGTDQSLLVWEREARRFAPDVAVMTVYENDYYDNVHDVRYGRGKPFYEVADSGSGGDVMGDTVMNGRGTPAGSLVLRNVPVPRASFWDHGIYNRVAAPFASLYESPVKTRSRTLHWLVKHSDLVRLVYRVSQSAPRLSTRADKFATATAAVTTATVSAAATAAATTAATAMLSAAAAGEAPATTATTTAPTTSTPTPREQQEHALQRRLLFELDNRTQGRLVVVFAGKTHPSVLSDMDALREAGIPVVDATTEPIQSKLQGPVYFPYNQHWTPPAHRAAAEMIVSELRRNAWCGPQSSPNHSGP